MGGKAGAMRVWPAGATARLTGPPAPPKRKATPWCPMASLVLGRDPRAQLASAWSARAVISSTLPVPLMARYLGAASGSAWAQLL
ncbi:hypothetical protein GmRootA79_03090 [Acidovorax sp. A79]